jgi:hypothetical protein
MNEVEILIDHNSRIWVSSKVFDFVERYEQRNRDGVFENEAIRKLDHLASLGLQRDEINIRHEGNLIYRIKLPRNGRIIGFFDNNEFIGLNCFKKGRQKLNRSQRKVIKKVAQDRDNSNWQRKEN